MLLEFPQVVFQPRTEFHMMDYLLKMWVEVFILIHALFPVYTVTQASVLPHFNIDLLLNHHQEKKSISGSRHQCTFHHVTGWTASPSLTIFYVNVQTRIVGENLSEHVLPFRPRRFCPGLTVFPHEELILAVLCYMPRSAPAHVYTVPQTHLLACSCKKDRKSCICSGGFSLLSCIYLRLDPLILLSRLEIDWRFHR